jgi:hypothetical protein
MGRFDEANVRQTEDLNISGPGRTSIRDDPANDSAQTNKDLAVRRWWDYAGPRQNDRDRFAVEDNSNGMANVFKQYLFDAQSEGWGGTSDMEMDKQDYELEKRGLLGWISGRDMLWANEDDDSGGGSNGSYGANTAKQKKEATEAALASIRNQLGVLGIPMTDDGMRGIAGMAVEEGWSQDRLEDVLLEATDWATTTAGTLTAGVEDIRNLGLQYLMPVSDETARGLSMRVASNELSLAGVRSLFDSQARKEYGFMSAELDQGITPADYFAPMRDVAADTLEISADTMNLMDNDVRAMFTTLNADGSTRAASLSEVKMSARKDKRYAQTQGAQDRISAMGSAIAQAFGGR